MSTETLLVETDGRGVCHVTMNRADLHNAFDDGLIARLTGTFSTLSTDPAVRVVVLQGAGKSFSAGADLNWMKRMVAYTRDENFADALGLARMLHAIHSCAKPVIARVHGPAFGGGVGLVAACDIAIAGPKASFCLSEVKLGLIPAAISPYVVQALGARACRRYFQSAERFDAQEAHRLGLVHEVTDEESFDGAVEAMITTLLANGPRAMAAAKSLIDAVTDQPVTDALLQETAGRIADIRVSDEGQEGLGAFLEKRKAAWVEG